MAAAFFCIRFFLKRRLLDLGAFLFAMVNLTLTQSAANIVMAIVTILIFTGYALKRAGKLSTYFYVVLSLIAIAVLVVSIGDVMKIFATRLSPEGDWEGMSNQLTFQAAVSAIPFVLVGHAAAFGSLAVRTEVGFFKSLLQLGLMHWMVLCWMLVYPLHRFLSTRSKNTDALPWIAAIAFGFSSMIHYGSLFRVTSVFLFFACYAMALVCMVRPSQDTLPATPA
jgi:hypothetical protein